MRVNGWGGRCGRLGPTEGEPVEIRFRAAGPEGERDLKSLYHWLSVDRSVRRTAEIERVEGTEPGRMSPVLDAVAAILSSAAALAEVARSYLGWRQGHRPESAVTRSEERRVG